MRTLPNEKDCRAQTMGMGEFAKCLVEHPDRCRFALPFGYGFLCRHPDREEIIRNTTV